MTTFTTVLAYLAVFIGIVSLAVYIFGIPPELKRKMESQALKTMGENKMSYVVKDQISKVPDSDQRDVRELKQRLGGGVGKAMQNPLGDRAGDTADDATAPLTGR